ncbi:MAG TPA: transposase [Tepidisphaeraceae bacterium]|nr:transposase [Tepidisphaeraceae bacterium]
MGRLRRGPQGSFGPTIRITIDRFHVMKNFQDRLNEARREIQRGLDKERAKELKGSRWLWVTNPENLTAQQCAELEALKKTFPELRRLCEHREALRQIFADKRITTPETAIGRLREWCRIGVEMGLKALKQFNKTMENWMEKIANYFVSRSSKPFASLTNGRTKRVNAPRPNLSGMSFSTFLGLIAARSPVSRKQSSI